MIGTSRDIEIPASFWTRLICALALALWCFQTSAATPSALPEFTSKEQRDWINSEPLRRADLRGKVVLLDIWTFECWNCYRSFPWLNTLEKRLGPRGLLVVGIHSPEYDREQERLAVAAKAREFDLRHPIMIDNDFRYWKALGNRVWPAFYLVDKQGRIRNLFVGETHDGEAQARRIEAAIVKLLEEPD